jgi:hypothetical protein
MILGVRFFIRHRCHPQHHISLQLIGSGGFWPNLNQDVERSARPGLTFASFSLIFKSRARISPIFGVEAAIFLLKTNQRKWGKWGAKPPT